jgi:trehalose 6-phosphate phosphatase
MSGHGPKCSETGGYAPTVDDKTNVLARSPGDSGLFFDFDGTLAEIVPNPKEARPLPGIPEELEALVRVFRIVCVVSGRSARQLSEWLGPNVEIWGLHGAQRAAGGRVEIVPEMVRFESLMQKVLEEARPRVQELHIPGILIEDKEIMVGLHWRMAEDRDLAERRLTTVASELVEKHGLKLGRGKMALELRPPVEISKKDVVARRGREESLRAAGFAGDDIVDLPAFDALDELSVTGVTVVKIAVESRETPAELKARADLIVDGPDGMLEWLQKLRTLSEGVAGSAPD